MVAKNIDPVRWHSKTIFDIFEWVPKVIESLWNYGKAKCFENYIVLTNLSLEIENLKIEKIKVFQSIPSFWIDLELLNK